MGPQLDEGRQPIGAALFFLLHFNRLVLHLSMSKKDQISEDALALLLSRQNSHCFYCGSVLEFRTSFDHYKKNRPTYATIDHVVPKNKGGSNKISNLVACCYPCNTVKSDLSFDKFMLYLTCDKKELNEFVKNCTYKQMENRNRKSKSRLHRQNEVRDQILVPRFILLWKYAPKFAQVVLEEAERVDNLENKRRLSHDNWRLRVLEARERREKNLVDYSLTRAKIKHI